MHTHAVSSAPRFDAPPLRGDHAHRVRAEVVRRGHALLTAQDYPAPLRVGAAARRELLWFARSYDRLPLDTFMADDGKYRRRRLGRFLLDARDGSLRRLPHAPFFQSRDHNRLNGGAPRTFAEMERETAEIPILTRLVWFHFASLPERDREPTWRVYVHQIRILAEADRTGSPAPEGLHRDGHAYVAQILIGRCNVWGGVSQVHTGEGARVSEICLERPLDSILLDDRRMLHDVSPIRARRRAAPATRDMLLIDFNPGRE